MATREALTEARVYLFTDAVEAISLAPIQSRELWNELAEANGGCFFHRHEWLTTMATSLGLTFHQYAVLAGKEPIGIAPVLLKQVGPLHTVNWLPFPYVGPLVPPEALPATLALLARSERIRALRSQQVLMSTVPRSAHYPSAHYTEHRDRTFLIDLAGRTEEELLQAVEGRRRAKLRKAVAAGAEVHPATARDVTELLPKWSAATFAAQRLPAPYPHAVYTAVWERFADAPEAHFSSAVVDGEPAVVQVTFAGAPRAVAWTMAASGTPHSSLAQPLLYWDTILWALRQGCREFDLVGAPTEGIARYKQDWGSREEQYTVFRHQAGVHRAAMRFVEPAARSRGQGKSATRSTQET